MVADPITEVWRRSEMLETAKILLLREGGLPATLIPDVARGDKDVAKLKFERDCAQVVYDNAQEAVMVYKKQIDVLREQIEREWSRA